MDLETNSHISANLRAWNFREVRYTMVACFM